MSVAGALKTAAAAMLLSQGAVALFSATPTPSRTPTPTPPTNSPTPSVTPSGTPTPSITPSTTPEPSSKPKLDIVQAINEREDLLRFRDIMQHEQQIVGLWTSLYDKTVFAENDRVMGLKYFATFPAFRSWLLNYWRMDRADYWLKLHTLPYSLTWWDVYASCLSAAVPTPSTSPESVPWTGSGWLRRRMQESTTGTDGTGDATVDGANNRNNACPLPHFTYNGTWAPWEVLALEAEERRCLDDWGNAHFRFLALDTAPFFFPERETDKLNHADFEERTINGVLQTIYRGEGLHPSAEAQMRFPTKTGSQYIHTHPNLRIFSLLLNFTSLYTNTNFNDLIDSEEYFTAFVPTDDAFLRMNPAALAYLFNASNILDTVNVIVYHVLRGRSYIYLAQFLDMTRIYGNITVYTRATYGLKLFGSQHGSSTSASLTISCEESDVDLAQLGASFLDMHYGLEGPLVEGAHNQPVPLPCIAHTVSPWVDLETRTGIFHKIDRVLIPPTVQAHMPHAYLSGITSSGSGIGLSNIPITGAGVGDGLGAGNSTAGSGAGSMLLSALATGAVLLATGAML